MYIYFQLDVNEIRHKNIEGQYSSKLLETQYLLSLALDIEARDLSEAESAVARCRLRSENAGVAVTNSAPD
jgi:hypothetical protein